MQDKMNSAVFCKMCEKHGVGFAKALMDDTVVGAIQQNDPWALDDALKGLSMGGGK